MYKRYFKRWLDFVIVFCVLLVIWPVLAVIAVWLHFANKGAGAFFTQERPGKDGKIFKVIKFKSMTDERDAAGKLLPDAQRLTKVGRFIRSTSLDELPQLINVLKGDMSLVGPRPLLPEYLPYYTKREKLRHSVKPGITGYAQTHGRNLLTWEEKLEMDVWYVEHLSLALDLKIMFLTVRNVIKKEGVEVVPKGVYLDKEREWAGKVVSGGLEIRLLEKRDLEQRVLWMRDSRVFKTMDLDPSITLEKTVVWFDKNRERHDRCDFVVEKEGEIVAFTGITGIKGEVGETYSFVSPEKQGKGYGTTARYLTCKYGFDKLALKKIVSYCNEGNVASMRVNDKLGYKYVETVVCKSVGGEDVTRRRYELTGDKLIDVN